MTTAYMLLHFGIFILISNFLCKDIEKRKATNCKAIFSSIGFTMLLRVLSTVLFRRMDGFSESGTLIFSCVLDVLLPIAVMILNLFLIAKFFQYGVTFPIWVLPVTILFAALACPIYIARLKLMLASMNQLFSGESIDAFAFLDAFVSDSQDLGRTLQYFCCRMPGIILTVFFVVKKMRMNHK
ncbi:MAG: hypothetical protein ACI4FY_02235 [Acetatifactor sp.]